MDKPATDEVELRGAAAVSTSNSVSSAAELFSGNCASCHAASGAGSSDGTYPSLMNNSAVAARDPSNLVMVILQGVSRQTAEGHAFMPGFAGRLDDAQVASLANHMLGQFGDERSKVDAGFVARQRVGGPPSPLPKLMAAGAFAMVAAVLALLAWWWRKRRSRQA
jgi:mono/diheme cytochrome c family protein